MSTTDLTADTTVTAFSVRIDNRGTSAGVFIGTTDSAGRYHQRAYYATYEAAQAALTAVRDYPWNGDAQLTIVYRDVPASYLAR